jgi:ubiquinone/menaquinone biosynthesis C-methylase UbiE
MRFIWPLPLYRFLSIIERLELEKNILDCGAGGPQPPLGLFQEYGYETHGIDISKGAIKLSEEFAKKHNMKLNIVEGDMREIPFEDESFSFVFSLNSLCHLTKRDTTRAIGEMMRVLKPEGHLLVDFMSTDSSYYGSPSLGKEVVVGEFQYIDDDGVAVLHSFHSEGEPEQYFAGMKIIQTVKTITETLSGPSSTIDVRIEYYSTKQV